MAVFSGGRWVRRQLENAGPEFWLGESVDERQEAGREPLGFSFLSFDGHEDGEDLKMHFKARLAEAEALLTAQEREEIVAAAQGLFEDCIALVHLLDREMEQQAASSFSLPPIALAVLPVLGVLLLLYIVRVWRTGY